MNNNLLTVLINSLSKSEKRYFKINSSINKTNKSLVELFDLIEAGKGDTDILLKQLNLKSKANLSVLETRLHQLIMKHLRNFHAGNTIGIELKNLLIEIEILHSKRLFKNCGKTILRAKKIAEKYNQHLTLLEILKWEAYIEKEQGKYLNKSQDSLKNILKKENEIIKDYSHLIDSRFHTFNLLLLSKNKIVDHLNKEIKNYDKLFETDKFDIKPHYSFDEKVYLLNFKGMYYLSKSDFKTCLEYYQKLLTTIEGSDRKNILKSNEYFIALNNSLLLQVMNNNFESYELTLKKIHKQFENLPAYKNLLFSITTCYELGIYCELGEVEKGMKVLPSALSDLKKYSKDINEINQLYFYLNIALLYFLNKDFSKSIYWLNTFLNDYSIKKNDVSSNLYYYAHIINMVVHFEAENFDTISYLHKESLKNLQKIRPINDFDGSIIKFIKEFAKDAPLSRKDKKIRFNALKNEISKISKNPTQTIALQFFDFFSWVDSHIVNKPIAQLIKTKRLG